MTKYGYYEGEMILQYGTIAKLKGKNWHYIELRSDKTVENTLRRVGKAIPGIFRSEAVELFIPVNRRDLDVFDLETSVYVFVRSTAFSCLLRLKSVTGVVSLVTEGETSRPSRAIAVPDDYVQTLIKKVEHQFYERPAGIKQGSFVRILDGETRDYCGHVLLVADGKACIKVDLKTKSLMVETPVRNLLNLSHVPENQRVFYYSPLVVNLVADNPCAASLIAEDLKFTENTFLGKTLPEIQMTESNAPKKFSRQRTVTALVKRLVSAGIIDPMRVAKEVVQAIRKKDIKPPKNLLIVYCIVKDTLMKAHFLKLNPQLENYRDVIHQYGEMYKFSPTDIAAIDTGIGIPVTTLDPAKDGRSREAREQKRRLRELEQERLAAEAAQAEAVLKKLPKRRILSKLRTRKGV
jgi:hypothetical protein